MGGTKDNNCGKKTCNIKVKICGLSRVEDIEAVNRSMPDYIGFVFAPSRRKIDDKTAAILKESLNPQIKAVGVFVNERAEAVAEIVNSGIIDLAQLHGDEDGAYIKALRGMCACPIIKSVSISADRMASKNIVCLLSHIHYGEPDYLIFDTLSPRRGGTGEPFDWTLLKKYSGTPYFLAGGLTAENVGEALSILSPFCVDVSGGIETDGFKDAVKIQKFVTAVRNH